MTTITDADIARSVAETEAHIARVRHFMGQAITNLVERAARHDASKLEEPERSGYAALSTRLADVRYDTPEYRAALAEAAPTIQHHYAHNDHHPNHYAGGINDMTLLSILEMLCDWRAASERTKDGSIEASIQANIARYRIDDQLAGILWQTAGELGWL